MTRKSASPITITPITRGHEQWPIDRRQAPDVDPMSLQMARAIIHLRKQYGVVTKARLMEIGFTPADIANHGTAARIRAAKLAPKLAHDTDRAFADAMQSRHVA